MATETVKAAKTGETKISTKIQKNIKVHQSRGTWKSSIVILVGVLCNIIYVFSQGVLMPKDDATPEDKLAHNKRVVAMNVSTIILTLFFVYRSFRTMGGNSENTHRGILDYATMGTLFSNNILVILCNLRNEETGSLPFILIIMSLCLMLLFIGLNMFDGD